MIPGVESACIDRAPSARPGKLISRNSADRYTGSDRDRVGAVPRLGYPLITFSFLPRRQMTSLSTRAPPAFYPVGLFVVRACGDKLMSFRFPHFFHFMISNTEKPANIFTRIELNLS